MDALGDFFRDVRAHGSVFATATLRPPWRLRFVGGAPLTLCSVLAGGGWIEGERGARVPVQPGDAVIVRGPDPFTFVGPTVADDMSTGDTADRFAAGVVECGADLVLPEQGFGDPAAAHGVGGDVTTTTTLVVAAYPVRGEVSRRLLDELPTVLRVAGGCQGDAIVEHLAAEIATDAPGQQVVLDRLLDWMLVRTLRGWFDRAGGHPPGWWVAQRDPVVGAALRGMHADPAAPWTVAAVADVAGVARSTLAKRFTDLVGESPAKYLTRLRMPLAADQLAQSDATVAHIARTVGYADPFGFSAAFTRVRGVSPARYRRQHADRPARAEPRAAIAAGGDNRGRWATRDSDSPDS